MNIFVGILLFLAGSGVGFVLACAGIVNMAIKLEKEEKANEQKGSV